MRLFNAMVIAWAMALAMGLILLCLLFPSCARAEVIDIEKLADAIYKAEGGAKTKHPYGILKTYKVTTPRQACINTIKSNLKRWNGQGDFILYLSRTYAPIGASNDPTGLNKNWTRNVKHFYNKQ